MFARRLASTLPRRIAPVSIRRFNQTLVPPPPPPVAAVDAVPPPPKKTGFCLVDYGGGIGFGSAVSVLGFYLYRQKTGQERRVALVEVLDDGAVVCPGEIKDIRNANLIR